MISAVQSVSLSSPERDFRGARKLSAAQQLISVLQSLSRTEDDFHSARILTPVQKLFLLTGAVLESPGNLRKPLQIDMERADIADRRST